MIFSIYGDSKHRSLVQMLYTKLPQKTADKNNSDLKCVANVMTYFDKISGHMWVFPSILVYWVLLHPTFWDGLSPPKQWGPLDRPRLQEPRGVEVQCVVLMQGSGPQNSSENVGSPSWRPRLTISGKPTKNCGQLPFIVDLPIKNGDFP